MQFFNNQKLNIDKKNDLKENLKDDSFIYTALTTFGAVFIAELGDKTQLSTLLLSAETNSPIIFFLASSLALILTSLIGVIVGKVIANKVNPLLFNKVAGILMILISIYIIYNLVTINIFR